MSPAEAFESYRPLLFAIVYEMTGSASEAEDLVQETYLRYHESRSQTEIRSLKAYLTTIATRLALDYAKSSRHTREQYIGTWLPEPLLTTDERLLPQELVERREAISMAFLVLLETLTPPERAVFLLREVFDFSYDEIAPIIGKSDAACRQLFHRAQERIAARKPRFVPASDDQYALVAGFVRASQTGEMDALVQALARDVTLWGDGGGKVPAVLLPLRNPATIARFFTLLARKALPNARVDMREVNGTPALIIWEGGTLTTVFLLQIVDARIAAIFSVRNPEKLTFIARQLASQP